jgi:acetyltransferase-like isoleucine patch superfamily enzyme
VALIESFILKAKRGETPFFRAILRLARWAFSGNLPLPRFLHPLLGALYHAHFAVRFLLRRAWALFWVEPLFRGRCTSVGKRLQIWNMPEVDGHAQIHLGNDVNIFGKIGIYSARIFDDPRLVLHDRVDIGHNVTFVVNKEVVIEEDVNVASGVRFMDSDAHPRDTAERIADLPPRPEEIKPVRICRHAWIGQNVFIMKGVTVGEGAIIGVNSVVVNDIPPFCVAMGNPARVVIKDAGKAADQPRPPEAIGDGLAGAQIR